jgi:hypothetical protein
MTNDETIPKPETAKTYCHVGKDSKRSNTDENQSRGVSPRSASRPPRPGSVFHFNITGLAASAASDWSLKRPARIY